MTAVPGRCIWCNGRGGELERIEVASYGPSLGSRRAGETWVHSEHRAAARDYFCALERSWRRMAIPILALAGLQLCAIALGVFEWVLDRYLVGWIGATMVLQGVIAFRHPFCTPETITLFGVRRSVQLARSIGVLLAVGGALLLSLGW